MSRARAWLLLRLLSRLGACLALLFLHRLVGSWLVGHDPIDALISASPAVALALLLLVPLRICAWLIVPVWLAAGTAADLWEAWDQRRA